MSYIYVHRQIFHKFKKHYLYWASVQFIEGQYTAKTEIPTQHNIVQIYTYFVNILVITSALQ